SCVYSYDWVLTGALTHTGPESPSGWRGGGRSADRIALDHQLDAAIPLAPLSCVIGSHRLAPAEAMSGDRGSRNALPPQEVANGVGAAIGKLLIELVSANAIGMPFDLQG